MQLKFGFADLLRRRRENRRRIDVAGRELLRLRLDTDADEHHETQHDAQNPGHLPSGKSMNSGVQQDNPPQGHARRKNLRRLGIEAAAKLVRCWLRARVW